MGRGVIKKNEKNEICVKKKHFFFLLIYAF